MRAQQLKLYLYLTVIVLGILTALPNLFTPEQLSLLPEFIPKQQVSLGLDLRGGSHLVLEVDAAALARERTQSLAVDARRVLRTARIETLSIRRDGNGVDVQLKDGTLRNAAIAALRQLSTPTDSAVSDLNIIGLSDGQIRLALTEEGLKDRVAAAIEQSVEIVRRRIDAVGVAEPTIQPIGTDRILVQLPGVQDPERIKVVLGSTAKLTFHMLSSEPPGRPAPPGYTELSGSDGVSRYLVNDQVVLAGDRLADARLGFDPQTNEPVVTFRFDGLGARQFGDITKANVGRPFAIVLDGKVLTAPQILSPILSGSGLIIGHFTVDSATDLAALLRAGALPAPLSVIEERTVGADLGSDAIVSGLETGLVGFGLVVGFMFFLYGWWGMLANLALALNVVLTFAALTLLGATLTLPGIAGIVLGIGLAVDANVLINERIREETRKGSRAIVALDAGFKRAYATIVDSNLTALIATLLLFQFGSGPVRGFAVTMGLGIAISMFTAVSIVRVLMSAIVKRRKLKTLRIEPMFGLKLVADNTLFRFMSWRKFGIAASAFLSIASVVLFFQPGLNYGVDFKGGIQLEVATKEASDIGTIRARLEKLGLGEITLQEFGGPSQFLIRAERQAGSEVAQTEAVSSIRAALLEVAPGSRVERTDVVGPKISGELVTAGFLSVLLASLAMLFYIWFRFEWPFAIGAIATLVLDVTKTVGFFALTGLEFNLTAIAALLTLIGYSVNDKVVVYDRVRENMRLFKAMPLEELIDRSINETLARSLYTSVTAFLALLPMALYGGSAVASFAVPMVFGILIAATSSVFIAAPILLYLGDWRTRRRVRKGVSTRPEVVTP